MRGLVASIAVIGGALLSVLAHAQVASPRDALSCFQGEVFEVAGRSAPDALSPSSAKTMLERAQSSALIAVGERHGVAAHALAAACLLSHLSADRPSVVLEHIRIDQQEAVNAYRQQNPERAAGLGERLSWWESGWPSWSIYEPLISTAWGMRAPVLGGDRPADAPAMEAAALQALFGSEYESARREWAVSMKRAHCDLIDWARAEALADQQMARDAAMAAAVTLGLSARAKAFFYAGRAHIRKTRSVPMLVMKGGGGAQLGAQGVLSQDVLSIALIAEGETPDLSGYDFVWRIGRHEARDVCARLAALRGDAPSD